MAREHFVGVWGHLVDTGGIVIGKVTNRLHEFIPLNGLINLENDVSLMDIVECVSRNGAVCDVDSFKVWGKYRCVFGIGGGKFTVW